MQTKPDLKKMDQKIQTLKSTALELKAMADEFPALYRNTARILAGVKMLELNVSDLIEP